MKDILKKLNDFRDERDWGKFHTPRNLASSISIEAAEVLEKFQWKLDGDKLTAQEIGELKEELADVFIYTIQLAGLLNIDLEQATLDKMVKNAQKYPAKRKK